MPQRQAHEVGRDRRRGALDRLVGHRLRHLDQRLDAAERLGQREQPRARWRSASASAWRKLTMPLNPGQRDVADPGRALQAADDGRGARGVGRHPQVQRAQPAVDEEAVERPRHGADGVLDEAQPLVESRSRVTTAPPTTSEWPPRYFVVECTTKSAPSSSGRWLTGVANVLSTATSASRAPGDDARDVDDVQQRVGRASRPRSAASRSRTARSDARRGRSGRRGRSAGPSALSTLSTRR